MRPRLSSLRVQTLKVRCTPCHSPPPYDVTRLHLDLQVIAAACLTSQVQSSLGMPLPDCLTFPFLLILQEPAQMTPPLRSFPCYLSLPNGLLSFLWTARAQSAITGSITGNLFLRLLVHIPISDVRALQKQGLGHT